MRDHSDLIERARAIATYNGAGVHDDLRAAIRDLTEALSSQSLSLSEAREEIERLRGERDEAARGHELVAKHNAEIEAEHEETFNRLEAAERQRDEAFEALRKIHNCGQSAEPDHWKFRCMAREVARSVLENRPAGLADAHTNPPLPDLSSLRKGAEVVGEIVMFAGVGKEVSWRKGKMPPVGTKLCAHPPLTKEEGE